MQQPVLMMAPDQQQVADAIDATPTPSAMALRGLQAALREQILAVASGEITSKTLGQLQRFCASAGQALVTLEQPELLVRSRFGYGGGPYNVQLPLAGDGLDYGDTGVLSPAPQIETYGANASRGLIESAAKIGKDIVQAQADAQAKAREPSLSDMITSLAIAKNAKVSKEVLKIMEDQIKTKAVAGTVLALPASTEPAKTKTTRRKQ